MSVWVKGDRGKGRETSPVYISRGRPWGKWSVHHLHIYKQAHIPFFPPIPLLPTVLLHLLAHLFSLSLYFLLNLVTYHLSTSLLSEFFFFFFFWIQVCCPSRQGLMSDFTFNYATLWLPVPVLPLPLWPSSASSRGSPQVIAPHEDPAQKHCFQTHHDRNMCWCSTDWVDLSMLASFICVTSLHTWSLMQ